MGIVAEKLQKKSTIVDFFCNFSATMPIPTNFLASVVTPTTFPATTATLVIFPAPVANSDNGNFVLRDVTSGENLWQSFENPCDTFLSGSILGFNLKTREDYKLTSWESENDSSPGNFTLGIRKKTPPEIGIWINNGSKSTIYSKNGPWNKLRFTSNGNPKIYSLYKTPFNLVENVDQGTTYFNNSILYLSLNGIVMVLMKDKGDYGNV
ncbi:G-type lectin S-receptor-like serine/threonine-protein kinase At1g11280 [Cannabis sativa]|uniref:G-type lectin S-receptor-like serine/threonine-protein kinase At1g11280 n=1 Tax=Cannabis sativa TaxID=3483 RepID=UPI0029CA1979|nr:G-type lectin S-receptor-like serine/threonine-protein kinase At1g11280 [Cannabis sativa]